MNLGLQIKKVKHRGGYFCREEENTLFAFQRAVNDQTCHGAECDVRFSGGDKPRELVVVHDFNLGRTHDLPNVIVAETSADELYTKYRVPRLSSVLEVFRDSGKTLFIDYKMSLDGEADTLLALEAAKNMAREADVTIVHLVWNHNLELDQLGLNCPVYFVRDVKGVDPDWGSLKANGYAGVSLKYPSDDFVATVENLVRNDLSVNVYITDDNNLQAAENTLLSLLDVPDFQDTCVLTVNDPPRHVVHDPGAQQNVQLIF